MAISPDGKTLATAQMGNKLKLWNLADGRLLQEIATRQSEAGDKDVTKIAGLFFADEGRKLVAVASKPAGEQQVDWSVPAAASAALIASPSLLAASTPSGMALAQSAMSAGSTAIAQARQAAESRAAANGNRLKIASLADSLEYQTITLADPNPPRVERFDPAQLQTTVLPMPFDAHAPGAESHRVGHRSFARWQVSGAGRGAESKPGSGTLAGGKLIICEFGKRPGPS